MPKRRNARGELSRGRGRRGSLGILGLDDGSGDDGGESAVTDY